MPGLFLLPYRARPVHRISSSVRAPLHRTVESFVKRPIPADVTMITNRVRSTSIRQAVGNAGGCNPKVERSLEMNVNDPDLELWRRAQSGDRRSFDLLRARYRPMVRGTVRRWLHYASDDDLEDIDSYVWIAVWKSLGGFRGACAFSTWVVSIAKNASREWLRKSSSDSRGTECVIQEARVSMLEEREDEMATRQTLRDAIRNLPDSERQLICLRYFAQLTDEEIAARVDAPLGTVKSRLRAGLKRLRVCIGEEDK